MFKILLSGIIVSQFLASIQVYISNKNLYNKILLIQKSGYLSVPNQKIMPELIKFSTAFFGGFFFTLSIGLGISIVSFIVIWLWHKFFYKNTIFISFLFIIWIIIIILLNIKQFSFINTLYFIIIPLTIFSLTKFTISIEQFNHNIFYFLIIILFILIPFLNQNFFINFRDRLLLSNTIGTTIVDFYYKYTMYPAEVFKNLNQKQIKTLSIQIKEHNILKSIEERLIDYDYLNVKYDKNIDLTISLNNNILFLKNNKGDTIKTSIDNFFTNTKIILDKFSQQYDNNYFFRFFVFLSILLSLPIMAFITIYFVINITVGYFIKKYQKKYNDIIIAIFCCIVIFCFQIIFLYNYQIDDNYNDLSIVKRYYSAKKLADSRNSYSDKLLIKFLDDPNPNVVCMALNSISQKDKKYLIPIILNKIIESNHWYVQWYGYNSLRALGWKQEKFK